MKEYSLQEIFDLPEGIEYINADSHFEVRDGVLYNWFKSNDKQSVRLTKMYVNMKFIKINKPITFNGVLNSNKKCRVEHEIIDKILDETSQDASLAWRLRKTNYTSLANIMESLGHYCSGEGIRDIIKEGRWHLESES